MLGGIIVDTKSFPFTKRVHVPFDAASLSQSVEQMLVLIQVS